MGVNKLDRAKQFLPFDALKGFKEALIEKEKIFVERIELSEESSEQLSKKINNINKGNYVKIKHYCNRQYIDTKGIVKIIDAIRKKIFLKDNVCINIDDILDIEII